MAVDVEKSIERPAWVREDLGNPTGEGVRIGVIDSGWDEALSQSQVQEGIGFVDPDDDLALKKTHDSRDRIGHGTACADLIIRIAPGVEITPIRVFGQRLETSPATLRAALLWAIEQELNLVNVSLGTLRRDSLRSLYAACELAREKGIVVVAATHNANDWSFPAVFENVISVGVGDFSSPFAYYYRPGDAVECISRGKNQTMRWLGGAVVSKSGTSFATPNITGIVALFLERHPEAGLEEIRALLASYAS